MPFPDLSGLRMGLQSRTEFVPSPAIIAAGLRSMAQDVESFKEPLRRAVREVLIPSIQQNFASGGRPAWQPLADYTVTVRGSARPILVRSGHLQRTMGQERIWNITDNHAVIQNLPASVWYGSLHQAGNKKNVTIPARPFALIQPQDQEKIEQVFDEWLGEQAQKNGWS